MIGSAHLIKAIRTGAVKLLPVIFAAAGFCAGALARLFVPSGIFQLPAPDMTSAFLADAPFAAVIGCAAGEFKYVLLIFLLGFCTFGSAVPSAVLAFRAMLAGYSAAYMLEGGYGLAMYFTHACASIAVIMALCCLAKVSSAHSENFVRAGERKRGAILSYTAKSLFYAGMVFAAVLFQHLLLAFIHV